MITLATPFGSGDEAFSLATWAKPLAGSFDGNWHGFIGYQAAGTRSPSLWVNHAGTDCNPVCGAGPGGGNNGPLSDDGGDKDPDSRSQSGMHWDTRTTQNGEGGRFAGVVDSIWMVDVWVNIVWTHAVGGKDIFYKNGVSVCGQYDCQNTAPHSKYCRTAILPYAYSPYYNFTVCLR